MIYRTLPDEPQTKLDLLRFSLKLPGLARELWMVFFMALLAALLGLVDPDRGRDPGRSGHSRGRPRGAGRDVWFPGRPLALGGDIPGDPGALGPSHRRTRIGNLDSGDLGPVASASHRFFHQVQLG